MNFLLAVLLFSLSFWLGVPQPVEEVTDGKAVNERIQIVDVGKNSPAEAMGLRAGDEILGAFDKEVFTSFSAVEEVQNFVGENKGERIEMQIRRGKSELKLAGEPRSEYADNEGPLGIDAAAHQRIVGGGGAVVLEIDAVVDDMHALGRYVE